MNGPKIRGLEFMDNEDVPKVGAISDDLMGIEDEPEEEIEVTTEPEKPDDKELPFECEICQRRFKNEGGLALHQKIIHKHVKGLSRKTLTKKSLEAEKRYLSEKSDGKKWDLNVNKTLPFDAELLAVAQMMLNEGVASDFQSLIKKALYGMAHRSGYPQAGGETMNKPDEMAEFIEKLQNSKMKKELYETFNQEKNNPSDEIDMNRIIKIMEQKYKMEMLQGMAGGGGMDMNKMMMNLFMSQMMKSMMEPKMAGPSPEVIALQAQLQNMTQQLNQFQQEAKDAKFEQLIKATTTEKQDQKGTFQDFLLAQKRIEEEYKAQKRELENALADRDEEMRTKEQEQFKSDVMNQIKELSKKNIGNWGEAFQEKVQQKILDKLDLDKLMDEKKESGWDKVRDIVGTVVREAGPILQPMIQAKINQNTRAQPMVTPEQLQAMQMERMRREQEILKHPPQKEERAGTPTPTGIIPEATDEDWGEGEE